MLRLLSPGAQGRPGDAAVVASLGQTSQRAPGSGQWDARKGVRALSAMTTGRPACSPNHKQSSVSGSPAPFLDTFQEHSRQSLTAVDSVHGDRTGCLDALQPTAQLGQQGSSINRTPDPVEISDC